MKSYPDNSHSPACNQGGKKSMLSMISVNENIGGLISSAQTLKKPFLRCACVSCFLPLPREEAALNDEEFVE